MALPLRQVPDGQRLAKTAGAKTGPRFFEAHCQCPAPGIEPVGDGFVGKRLNTGKTPADLGDQHKTNRHDNKRQNNPAVRFL